MGGRGLLKTNNGSAEFMNEFFIKFIGYFKEKRKENIQQNE